MRVTAQLIADRIRVLAPYALKGALKAIDHARWNKDARAWEYPATPAMARKLYLSIAITETDVAFERLLDQAMAEANGRIDHTAADLPAVPSKTDAWEHQRRAFWFAASRPAAMLAMDMGTGKSKVAADLLHHRKAQRILIACPKAVCGVWPRELLRHSLTEYDILVLGTQTVAQRLKLAKTHLALAGARKRPCVIVINHEGVWREPFGEWCMHEAKFDAVVLDEAHRAKASDGQLSKFVWLLGERVPLRLALTGTPMPHSPLDVFAQYRFLDSAHFGTSWFQFRRRYAVLGGFNQKQVVGYQNAEELQAKFFELAYRVTKEQALDLPDTLHIDVPVIMSPDSRRIYEQLEGAFYTEVEGGEVTALNAAVHILRLQQVTSGFVGTDDGEVSAVGEDKRVALGDLLADARPPVVVFCRFRRDLEAIRAAAEAHGLRYGEISGARKDLTPTATMPDNIDVMGVIIQAGGVGIDLTRAATAVYYSLDYNLANYEQSLARLHRPGQTRKVTYYHLIAEATIDESIYAALQKRANVVEDILSQGRPQRKGIRGPKPQGKAGAAGSQGGREEAGRAEPQPVAADRTATQDA